MLHRLDAVLATSVHIEPNTWVTTPNGELPVSFVLEGEGKRVAIQVSTRLQADWSAEDALVLVYGGFDALYRIHVGSEETPMDDALMGIMLDHTALFSHVGRLSIGRRVSSEILWAFTASSVPFGSAFRAPSFTLRRMRLNVATDWVAAFEKELGGRRSHAA